jgi:DNA-binding NarL/FixJ family response regulator
MVTAGQRYVSPDVAQHLALSLINGNADPTHEILSDREYQVMLLLAQGNPVSQIAEQLSLSVKTVSTYRSRILTKLKLSNNLELMRYALEHGLL